MIRMGRYIYVHFLTIAMFIVFALNNHIAELAYSYLSMIFHEAAHLLSAKAIGLRISHISMYPFGVNLKLKNKLVANIADELILYLSGPVTNLIIALSAVCLRDKISGAGYLYYINILLFTVNMLPVIPLDGGCILKGIIASRVGTIRANRFMKVFGVMLTVILIFTGIQAVIITGYNYSVLLFAVFIAGNIFTQKEKYNTEYIRELMFYREKPLRKVKLTAAYEDDDIRDIAKKFTPGAYSIVCEMDKRGKINRFRTETEIIEKIFEEN